LKDEKEQRSQNEQKLKSIERVNYFPFTHGDMIEKQRKALNELQKHEQLDAIKGRAQDELARKRNQARLNAEANEQMLLSFQRQVMDEQMEKQRMREATKKKPFNQSGSLSRGEHASQTSAEASPVRPNLFLKNSSAHLPPRRQQLAVSNAEIEGPEGDMNGNQYQLAMSEALARHEQELQKVSELRKLQEQDFRKQIKLQEEILRAEQEQKQFRQMQMHAELGQQIQEFEARKNADVQDRRAKVMTSGGPTQESEDYEALMKKFKD